MELRVKVNSYFHKIFCVFLVIRNKTSTSAFYVNNNRKTLVTGSCIVISPRRLHG